MIANNLVNCCIYVIKVLMIIILEINDLPKTPNSMGKASIWASHAERHKWRKKVSESYCELISPYNTGPIGPFKKAILRLTRYSSKEPDVDNLYSSWKFVIDALKYNGIILDDKPSVIDLRCYWKKTKPKEGKIEIHIEEIGESNG